MRGRNPSVELTRRVGGDIEPELLRLTKEFLENQVNGTVASPEALRAWENFYSRYLPIIRDNLRWLALREPELSDCTQDVWKKLITQLSGFQHDSDRCSFRSWLQVLVRHQAIDLIRRERRWVFQSLDEVAPSELVRGSDSPDSTPKGEALVDELQPKLQELSRSVSPRTYQVLTMRWLQNRSVAETARALGMTHRQVWTCYHRAKKRLIRLIEQSQSQTR
jgi:RNA polymerase sigma-70 factor, ECF subfamily